MPPIWSISAEQTVVRLLARPLPQNNPEVIAEARRLGAIPIGWDLWSHYFLRPDGTLVRVNMEGFEDGREKEEVFTDRVHVLWALVHGSELYPELGDLIPAREAGAQDCECIKYPPVLARVFCPRCGNVRWLPDSSP
jgi:hypothetical protein